MTNTFPSQYRAPQNSKKEKSYNSGLFMNCGKKIRSCKKLNHRPRRSKLTR